MKKYTEERKKNSYNLLTYIFIFPTVSYMRAFKFMDYNQVYRKWHNLVQIKEKKIHTEITNKMN